MCLHVRDHAYLDEIKTFARQVGLAEQLDERLDYLDTYAEHGDHGKTRCLLCRDFAPYSCSFVMEVLGDDGQYRRWFNGGLIFHGPHDNGGDGSYPTLSVTLNPVHGWQVHT